MLGRIKCPFGDADKNLDFYNDQKEVRICIPIHPFDINDIISGAIDAILITTYTAQKSISRYLNTLNVGIPVYQLYDID